MMKINAEKMFLIIFVVVLSAFAIYFVSPGPDNYVYYTIANAVVKDPLILWRTDLTGWQSYLALQTNSLAAYPPLEIIVLAGIAAVGLPTFLLTIVSISSIGYFLYKMDGKAIPFMFLSFMFIRESAFNGNDIFMVAMTLASFYFLTKKKIIPSAVFVGLLPLIKSSGIFIVLGWLAYVVITEKKNVLSKKFLVAIAIALLISAPWYLRNFFMFDENPYLAVLGVSQARLDEAAKFQTSGFQSTQPEKSIWDSTGYYPLPIDLLFYVGTGIFLFNLIRKKQLKPYTAVLLIMIITYFVAQLSSNPFFQIRHEMIIFPLLALEIAAALPEKYLKYALVVCLIMLVAFSSYLPKYSFNQYYTAVQPAFKQIKTAIDSQPVYINAFHGWFITYESGLNATTENDSKWTLDFENGKLYLTNKTNITG